LLYRAIEKWGSLENIQLQKDLRKAREKQEHAGLLHVYSSYQLPVCYVSSGFAVGALTLLVGRQEECPTCKIIE